MKRIIQLRKMLCLHSYIYYILGESIVTDSQWDKWAYELVELQKKHGWQHKFYDREFYDWDGSTGMHLPKDDMIIMLSAQLLNTHKKLTEGALHL